VARLVLFARSQARPKYFPALVAMVEVHRGRDR
jgi:hypothetical protein